MSKLETIKDFLNSEKNPCRYEYDLTLDCVGENVRSCEYKNENCVDRFFTYHDSDNLKINIKHPDEYSVLLQKIFRCLWDFKLLDSEFMKNRYLKLGDNKFVTYADCMTSVYVAVNLLFKIMYPKKFKDVVFNQRNYGWNGLCKIYKIYKGEEFSTKLKQEGFSHAVDFIKLYHTIGNYCPVPWCFNSERSGYDEEGKKEKWVDSWDNPDIPADKLEEFFVNASSIIKSRGERMFDELLKRDKA